MFHYNIATESNDVISTGSYHTVFVSNTGQVYTCGNGTYGQLGHGYESNVSIPKEVEFFTQKNMALH